jgi:hypothetical protein
MRRLSLPEHVEQVSVLKDEDLAMVISRAGKPPPELGNNTRRLSLHIPLRMGYRPVSSAARLGVQTEAAT